jgi:hypothetical protein
MYFNVSFHPSSTNNAYDAQVRKGRKKKREGKSKIFFLT